MKLLPYKFKTPGILMVVAGLILTILYFVFNFRFELPVFSVVSSYMNTNFADEAIMLLLLLGFSLWIFSKEKHESDGLHILRTKALTRTILTNLGILLFTIIFISGSGFIACVLLNMILPFVLYLSFFYYLKAAEKRRIAV